MSIDTIDSRQATGRLPDREVIFPSSTKVKDSLDQFNERSASGESLRPRDDIADILHVFAHQHSNDALYDAAHMVDLADRLSNDLKRPHATRALSNYLAAQYNLDKERYVTSIVSDIGEMNEYIEQREQDWLDKDEPNAARIKSAIDYNGGVIPAEVWDKDSIPPDLESLADLAENVNLEAVLVKSAQMLQLLRSPVTPGAERMRTVLAIESTYAPLCELSGFDALAATLLSEATCTRLEMSGNGQYIEDAKYLMAKMGNIDDVEQFIKYMPSVLIGDSEHEAIVDHAKGYNVHFSHSHSQADALVGQENPYIDSVLRIKTLGSIARKLQHHKAKGYDKEGAKDINPADIIGMTIIAEDNESVGLLVRDVTERLASVEGLKFVCAPSREKHVQVKGPKAFNEEMEDIIRQVEPSRQKITVHPDDHDGGFEAVKITVRWPVVGIDGEVHELPIEIQITHRESRDHARTGEDSHTLFKLRKYSDDEDNKVFLNSPKAVECLKRIRARKDKLLANVGYGINKRSRVRSEELFNEMRQATPAGKLGRQAYHHADDQ